MRVFILFLCLSTLVFGRYKTLDGALLNGNKQVDIMLYGDYMHNQGASGFFANNLYGSNKFIGNNVGYMNVSVGLSYTTAFFYNFRAGVSFRAAQELFGFNYGARKDFYNNGNNIVGQSAIALGESFIEYYDGDTAIKLGRFQPINEFVNHLIDGIWFRNGSLNRFVIEAMWAYNYGRVSYYEISPFKTLDKIGWFNIGLRYYFTREQKDIKNSAYLSGFSTFIPGIFATVGIRGHWAMRINGPWWVGVDAGFAASIEDHNNIHSFNDNTFMVDTKVSFGYRDIDGMVGYVGTGDAGMGSLGVLGVGNGTQAGFSQSFYNNIQPFFIWGGRAIKTGRNAHLIYLASRIGLLDNRLNMYFAYGATFFNGSRLYGGNAFDLKQGEFNAMIEYSITRTLSSILHLSSTHFGGGNLPNTFEINGGIRLMF